MVPECAKSRQLLARAESRWNSYTDERCADARDHAQMERLSIMMSQRKLALVLDLDHTLLHTTIPRSVQQVGLV